MLPRDIIIILALVSLVVGASAVILTEMNAQYPELSLGSSSNFTNTYDKLSSATVLSKQTFNQTISGEEAVSTTGEISVKGLWAALLLPVRSIGIFNALINDAGKQFMIPIFILTIVSIILTTTIVFIVLGAIFKRRL